MSESIRTAEFKDISGKKPYEAIVVMSYSSGLHHGGRESKIDPDFGMTYESKLVATAAAQAYGEGKSDRIILVGEQTVGAKEGELTTDKFMKEFFDSWVAGAGRLSEISARVTQEAFEPVAKHANEAINIAAQKAQQAGRAA